MTSNRLPGAIWMSVKLSTMTPSTSGMIWARRRAMIRCINSAPSAVEPDVGPTFAHEVRGGGMIAHIRAGDGHRFEIDHRQHRRLGRHQFVERVHQLHALLRIG